MPELDHRELYAQFADTLRQARKDAGLTQVELAKLLARPQSFVAKYEGCERRLDSVEFLIIAKALKTDWKLLLDKTASKIEHGIDLKK